MIAKIKRIIDFIFPLICIFCGEKTNRDLALCDICENDLPWIQASCYQCGLPFNLENNQHLLCPLCQKKPPAYDHTIALFYYHEPIAELISHLKFYRKLVYAECLGSLMAKRVASFYEKETSKPELIIPMPLHKMRLQERGFNQALELAKPIKKRTAIPISPNTCHRTRATEAQSSLKASKQRADNVKNAFLAGSLLNKHILLIDDVITTGNTINELSKACRQQGARRIDVACCARTSLKL